MSQKPDYYEVLGVAKTASVEEIEAAFKKITMKNHPDMLRGKSEPEKIAAGKKFQLAKEAREVLTDASSRATYDKYGHQGLENIKNSGTTGKSQSYTDAAGPMKMKTYTEEDTDSFFKKGAGGGTKTSSDVGSDGLTADQRREKNRQERFKKRGTENNNSAANNNTSSVTETFSDVAEKVVNVTGQLKDAVLPVDVLERFRDNLQDFLKEVDAAIVRARKNGGPQI